MMKKMLITSGLLALGILIGDALGEDTIIRQLSQSINRGARKLVRNLLNRL